MPQKWNIVMHRVLYQGISENRKVIQYIRFISYLEHKKLIN
jgi:hypothetical protein